MRIIWKSNFDLSRFGRASVNYVFSLKKLGVNIRVIDTSIPGSRLIKLPFDVKQIGVDEPNKNDILIQHALPNEIETVQSIVCTIFNYPEQIDFITTNNYYGIIVPFEWNRKLLCDTGIEDSKIHVIPHIVSYSSLEPEHIEPFIIQNKKTFSFLSIVDMDRPQDLDLVLNAYWSEFRPDEDVSLVLKVFNNKNRLLDYIKKPSKIPSTLFYDWPIHDFLIPSFYKSCQVYICTETGGKFGLTSTESIFLGIPTISTHSSEDSDYMSYGNGTLIKVSDLSDIERLTPENNIETLREEMRRKYIYYNDEVEKLKQIREDIKVREDIKDRFSEVKVGIQLLDAIEAIAEKVI